ncbi:MAG: Do family serine endopeptidase [Candidatus Omnitrophica bacterium]|nr:Do family serine endopeptidase [Candidatus Omnitrophota bacterium]
MKRMPLLPQLFIINFLLIVFGMTFIPTVTFAQDSTFITAIETVAGQVGPAVVSIKTEKVQRYRAYPRYRQDPFYDDFLNQFFGEFFGGPPEYEKRQQGLGSGVIIDKTGYILTNEHVVREADRITVTLPDGRSFNGIPKGTDPRSDLALIKIEAPDLPVAIMGDSENLKTGQWVVAIGNPFGHILDDPQPTVTSGVISALHRSLPTTSKRDTDYSDLIQTDAAINPGNSGGPLVNLRGEVVGINVAIFSTSGGYQGVGFAIPINYAKAIVDKLIKGKKVTYGWLGVMIQDLDYRLAQYFGTPKGEGVLIEKVVDDGPAEIAGIRDGDVVLSVDGVKMRNTTNLIKYIGNAPIGKKVSVEILRDRKKIKIPVEITKRPFLNADIPEENGDELPETVLFKQWRGLKIRPISEEIAQRLRLGTQKGVVVFEVETDSPAQEAGLRKGDIIISVNKHPVETIKDFHKIVNNAKGDCLIRTVRGYFVICE